MDILKYNKKTYYAPANWQECDPEMVAKLIVFSRLAVDDITDEVFELLVQIIFMIPAKRWATWTMTVKEWQMLKDQVKWVFTAPEDRPFLSFEHEGINYILPEENFADTTALELSMAFIAYTDFADPDQPDPTALNRLIATLCRPARPDLKAFLSSPDWTGDDRETFNEARMMKRSDALASMDIQMKMVILSYFEVQAKSFLEQYEGLFGGDSAPRYGDGRGWIMLLKNIAKEGHFGDFDNVGKQYAHLVYAAALDDTITAEETRDNQDNGYEY